MLVYKSGMTIQLYIIFLLLDNINYVSFGDTSNAPQNASRDIISDHYTKPELAPYEPVVR